MSIASELRSSNYKSYQMTYFDRESFRLFIKGLEKYVSRLKKYREVEAKFGIEKSELESEIKYTESSLDFLEKKLAKSKDSFYIDFFGEQPVSEVFLRLWKAALLIEKESVLKDRVELIREDKNIPKVILDGIDQVISKLESSIQMGLFASLEPYPLMVSIYNPEDTASLEVKVENKKETKELIINEETRGFDAESRTTVLERTKERVVFYDDELRNRMENLLGEKRIGYYDTALREACIVVEDRIRRKSQSQKNCTGKNLLERAFNPQNGRLMVSQEEIDRYAFTRLIYGFMEYIRNPNSHNLSGDVERERAIQITGFADYILSIIENSDLRS